MSEPDAVTRLRQRAAAIVGAERVYADRTHQVLHSYDASMEYGRPDLVVAPTDRGQFRALVAAAYDCGVPFVPRGAGTGYSGGALAAHGGMVILTAGLNRVLNTDFDAGRIRCEPGVTLATVHALAASAGWRYIPDPSSHQVCTLGGNIAQNAGGPHALGGGPTVNYVQALELIRPDGSITELHEQQVWDGALDLCSLLVGSEATLGAVAAMTLRLVRAPECEQVLLARFDEQEAALATVTRVFQLGVLPSAMDMLTGGYIPGASAFTDTSLLFVQLCGHAEEVAAQTTLLSQAATAAGGSVDIVEVGEFLSRRAELVKAKVRRMVAASQRPRYYLFDATAPRSKLVELMSAIRTAADEFGLPVLNTFHAGDGNVHPTPFYDPDEPGVTDRLRGFSEHILRRCAQLGGALSGEHGIGLEKRQLMAAFYHPDLLDTMRKIKVVFDPPGLANPGKLLPAPGTPSTEMAVGIREWDRPGPDIADAYLEITDPAMSFADAAALLTGTPYELCFEPLGCTADDSVLAAIDTGLPGVREPRPLRARDLVLGARVGRWQVGGTVAKDVAGYELRKLVYGGRGRLGPLTGLRLRLLPAVTDSRRIRIEVDDIDTALATLTQLHRLTLPFAHLGILLTPGQAPLITGRMELRGGVLDRQLETLAAACPTAATESGPVWGDPPLTALATGALAGSAGAPWDSSDLLRQRSKDEATVYASVGHRRTWWTTHASPPVPTELDAHVARAFTRADAP
ncbi:FAD-linked oxidase C-terminal domain-containing protein [Nocardia gipuzkoensis]|uniref:FAD-linked oxidase C-terminal domain-containing protein n=1 Tax=Nocardia gipuzkoensis TaxID=2749991 RepID=UPI00237E5099|nr:FAD-linked oxidase C-terminal domain-containing protein [Nocardia gipuzkoensis]MDE1674750.1 FAD-linked oxidase C-terminal domain-containing protein [Nocardia gipuzkoensis]